MTEHHTNPRRSGVLAHLRRNFVGYFALVVAVSMTPLPSQAAAALIGTSDIKNGAVTTKKIAKHAVVSKKIRNGSVKTQDLRDSSVTSAKIADGTASAADLAAGSVTASKLGTITVRSAEVVIANATGNAVQVSCLAGERVISGGVNTVGVGTAAGWSTIRSGPIVNGWDAAARNETGGPGTLIVRALCLAG